MQATRFDTRKMSGPELMRRMRMRELDTLLSQLEVLNLHDAEVLPQQLSHRLLMAGVATPRHASISHVIDLVFRAQDGLLRAASTRRWSAA